MSQRAEISKKNEYWISKHRYYELKHFCLQYPEWKKGLDEISLVRSVGIGGSYGNYISNPTADFAEKRETYRRNILMVEETCKAVDPVLWSYIFEGVIEGFSYDTLRARFNIPCCKDEYYKLYREFFWLLDKRRK